MIWLAAAAILIAVIGFAIQSAGFRFFLLGAAVLLVGFGFWLYQANAEQQRRNKRANELISPEQVRLTDVKYAFQPYGSSLNISGRIANSSGYEASDVTLAAELFDCPEVAATPPKGCVSVGLDDDVWVSVTVPPGGTRALDAIAYMPNVPPIRGQTYLQWRVVKARANV